MKHLPIGYRIEYGEIVVCTEQAVKVQCLFENYLQGYSLEKAAKKSGITGYHGTISKILSNRKYIGILNYPPIITEELFLKVQKRRQELAKKLGRHKIRKKVKERTISLNFVIENQIEKFDDPYQDAQYKYSLIKMGEM